jgi:hypothetical protein
MSYNLSEANGGFSVLVPATTTALGSTGGVVAGYNVTTTGTAQLNFNGIVKALAPLTNQVATFGPSIQTQTYQQQIAPKNLPPSAGCLFIIACDDAATPNLYWFQGPIVDASQNTFPIPGPGSVVNSATVNPAFNLPNWNINVVPLLAFSIVTTAAQAYQVPGGAALPTISGVTNYQYAYTSLTAPIQTALCSWPSNSLI